MVREDDVQWTSRTVGCVDAAKLIFQRRGRRVLIADVLRISLSVVCLGMTSVGSKMNSQCVVCEWTDAPGLANQGGAMSEVLWGMSEIIVRHCCSMQ